MITHGIVDPTTACSSAVVRLGVVAMSPTGLATTAPPLADAPGNVGPGDGPVLGSQQPRAAVQARHHRPEPAAGGDALQSLRQGRRAGIFEVSLLRERGYRGVTCVCVCKVYPRVLSWLFTIHVAPVYLLCTFVVLTTDNTQEGRASPRGAIAVSQILPLLFSLLGARVYMSEFPFSPSFVSPPLIIFSLPLFVSSWCVSKFKSSLSPRSTTPFSLPQHGTGQSQCRNESLR